MSNRRAMWHCEHKGRFETSIQWTVFEDIQRKAGLSYRKIWPHLLAPIYIPLTSYKSFILFCLFRSQSSRRLTGDGQVMDPWGPMHHFLSCFSCCWRKYIKAHERIQRLGRVSQLACGSIIYAEVYCTLSCLSFRPYLPISAEKWTIVASRNMKSFASPSTGISSNENRAVNNAPRWDDEGERPAASSCGEYQICLICVYTQWRKRRRPDADVVARGIKGH